MTLMIGLHHFFLEMSKKCWPRIRVRNSTLTDVRCMFNDFLRVSRQGYFRFLQFEATALD
jgi:hypothetical protein